MLLDYKGAAIPSFQILQMPSASRPGLYQHNPFNITNRNLLPQFLNIDFLLNIVTKTNVINHMQMTPNNPLFNPQTHLAPNTKSVEQCCLCFDFYLV